MSGAASERAMLDMALQVLGDLVRRVEKIERGMPSEVPQAVPAPDTAPWEVRRQFRVDGITRWVLQRDGLQYRRPISGDIATWGTYGEASAVADVLNELEGRT